MNARSSVFALIIVTALASSAFAMDSASFNTANQAYNEGRFEEAARNYEKLIGSGDRSGNIFYNLGNAYYRLGSFGKAILNYERALALEPRHPEADANLRLALEEARALEMGKNTIERYAGMATVKQYSITGAISFWLALFLATQMILSRRRSAGRFALIALGLAVCALSIFGVYTLETGARGNALAIVTAKEADARLATADNAKSVLVLPAGSEIKILSERGDWIYAVLPNDQRGWIAAKNAERVRM
jgi:tetratricopeptide (TPR) repeat protein